MMTAHLKRLIKKGEKSPFYQLMNIKIEEVKEDYARLSTRITEKHRQFLDTVHGGVVAGLIAKNLVTYYIVKRES